MNKINEEVKAEGIGAGDAMSIGMAVMVILLAIEGVINGDSVAGFLAVYFAGILAKEFHAFFQKRTWKQLLPVIWHGGLMVAALALYFRHTEFSRSEFFLMVIEFFSIHLSRGIEGIKRKDWDNFLAKSFDWTGVILGPLILMFSIYAFVTSL